MSNETPTDGLEISRRKYEDAALTLKGVAEEVSSLSIPESTVESWKILLSSIRIVDDRIDHIRDAEERARFIEKIKSFLELKDIHFADDGGLEEALSEINLLSEGLEEEQQNFFHRQLSMILEVTENIKQEEVPKKLVALTALEGQLTSKLFLPFLPEEFRQSDKYAKLIHALSRLGRTGNSFDSLVDLNLDHQNEQIKIEPTILNRILFLGSVLSHGAALVKDTNASTALLKAFVRGTKDTIDGDSEK